MLTEARISRDALHELADIREGSSRHAGVGESPLYDVDVEIGLIGAVLNDNSLYGDISAIIGPNEFHFTEHQEIWSVIGTEIQAGRQASPFLLKGKFANRTITGSMSYAQYLGQLALASTSAYALTEYAKAIHGMYVRRVAIVACEDAISLARYNLSASTEDIISGVESAMFRTTSISAPGGRGSVMLNASAGSVLARIAGIRDGSIVPKVMKSGIYELDRITGGYQPGQLNIIAARTGVGKSALLQTIAMHMLRHGESIDLYTLEMSDEDFSARILSNLSDISVERITKGDVSDAEFETLSSAQRTLDGWNLAIEHKPGITLGSLSILARRAKKKRGTSVIFVDYIGLMRPDGGGDMTREALISIAAGLKNLAQELGVCIFALAQLNRDSAKEQGKDADARPQIHHIAGGALENDADKIVLIHREIDQKKLSPQERDSGLQNAELIVVKNRQGKPGTAFVKFEGATTTFVSKAEIRDVGGVNAKHDDDRPF
jgi:replicative DNA helicase